MRDVGRPLSVQRDAAVLYIAKRQLWDRVATACGITPTAVRLWHKVPPRRVSAVARAIHIPRYFIRPDLYDPQD